MPNIDPSNSPWPRRARRSSAALVLSGVFVVTLFIAYAPAQAAKPVRPTPTPAVCDLIPQLRDVTINQGVGAYTPLVRGKEALVRAYLSKPSCASSTDVVELVAASLAVTAGGTTTTISQPTPAVPTAPYPQLASFSAAALADSTADPLWVVPGSVLAPASTVARYTATFSMTITYRVNGSLQPPRTFTSKSGSTTPINATVEKRTNALRVLVVPMGNATRSFSETYTATGDAALQAAMLTVSRIFPVPDGVGSLTGTTGGLRYSVSPGMLDLSGLLGSDGKFCGTGGSSGNFNAIKASLGQFLQSWNVANGGSNQADRVLGVVDSSFSNGSNAGCAEGMAAIDSTEAWIRAVPETSGTPSQSGLVAALELGHTFGLVPDARDDTFSRYHSPNPFADPLRQNRSYNTRLRTLLYEDRTAMTFISAANNNNTLLEQPDWAYLICQFGGAATSDCSAPTVPVGSGAGVAAGPRFVISGVTDGTAGGTDVLESFFSADMLPTSPDPSSPYRLVYRDGSTILTNLGVPTTDEDSAHADEGDAHEDAGLALFSAAFDFNTAADRIELWNGTPGSGQLLYARDRNGVPSLDSLTVISGGDGAQNYTNNAGLEDIEPAITADGRWVAWAAFVNTEGGPDFSVRVAPVGDAESAAILSDGEFDIPAFQPAWCSDGAQLAYADDGGDLWTVDVDTSSVPATFGTPFLLYNGDIIEGDPPGSDPTWSPDCSQLAFEADDDIWRIDADGSDLVALTDDDRSHDPSWSPDPEDNRIAFARDLDTEEFATATLASFVEPEGPPITTLLHAGAHFLVTTTDDPGDGICDATCTLREAIDAANAAPNVDGPDVIEFDISGSGPHMISPGSALPAITDDVLIDGTTEPDYAGTPVIEIDGSSAGEGTDGLLIGFSTTGVTVRGLAINKFDGDGISVSGSGSAIESSYIGLGTDGSTAAGNNGRGIFAPGAQDLRIGVGADVGSGNVISGNGGHGIYILGGTALDPVTGTVIGGNLIGTDAAGTTAVGNGVYGLFIAEFTQGAQVGGLTAARRNVISGNVFGVVLAGAGAFLNVLEGNYIGTDVTGTLDLGNISTGIEIIGSGGNRIGGSLAGAANVISGNGQDGTAGNGIRITESSAYNNLIYGNRIGTDVTGELAVGNASDGIEIAGAEETRVGGASTQNIIAFNGEAGIRVINGTGNTFRANSIHGNATLGIDIEPEGVTLNDPDDTDSGANDLQNFPVITSAVDDGSSVTVEGSIDSVPDATITVDLYASGSCDPSGNGEGTTYLGEVLVNTNASGDATFSRASLSASIGEVITATGSEGSGNSTSEFSACFTVTGPATPTFTVNTADDHDDGACTTADCSLREAIDRANAEPGTDTISFDIGLGGGQTITVTEVDLPEITETVIIDGESQVGFDAEPLIRIDGGGDVELGLVVASPAADTVIRGLLVTGFTGNGIELHAAGTTLERSWIGLDHLGASAGNGGVGAFVNGQGATLADTVISANAGHGLLVYADDLLLTGSRIGTDPTGSVDLGNGEDGVHIVFAWDAIIGGPAALGNVISGNADDGVEISNGGEGDSGNHRIWGNLIGVDATGTATLPNGGHGINLRGAGETYVGNVPNGDDEPASNVISGNARSGIYLISAEYDLQFHGNLIGTDVTGTVAIGNGESGIFIDRSNDASIGEGDAQTRNVISGNAVGITLRRTDTASSVLGNYIGTDVSGTVAVPNGIGIVIDAGTNERIGGFFEGEANVISGNTGDGIYVAGDGELEIFADANDIWGNLIGTDATGTLPLGNGGNGITLDYATDSNDVDGNVIADNAGNGISIVNSYGNVIQDNFIGTDAGTTESLGNGMAGVRITGPSQGNQVGAGHVGTAVSGPGNVIAHNGGNGVEILQAEEAAFDADFTSILSNAIWRNGGLGIDLEADGVTENDLGDDDDASNDLKNFPDDITATSDDSGTYGTITTFSSASAEIIIFQLYANDACDPSGNGEGQRFLDTFATAANADGFAEASFVLPEDLGGQYLTATVSDNQGQTSEFSDCFLVTFDFGDPEREIRVLDAAEGGTSDYVTDGDQPFWGTDGILYRLNGIRRVQPDGSGDEEITDGSEDFSPTSGGGVIGYSGSGEGDGGDFEIYLISGANSILVSATDDIPADLRLDLYYSCGEEVMPIAVGLLPNQSNDQTANFQYNFDASLSCSGGEILAALSDGFSRDTTPPGSGEPIETDPKPPIASTYGPPLGSTYLTSDVIAFHGTGEDPDDGQLTGTSLQWYITPAAGSCCGSSVGSGAQVDYDASQLAPGDYVVTLVVTDSEGESDSSDSLIHVLADSDNDGFSDDEESTTCFGTDAATNGSTPSGDADSDGIPNGSDPDPCVRAPAEATATANFDPDDFSLSSKGTWVTIYVRTPGRDIRQIITSSVRIVEIAGSTVNFANDGISYKGDQMVVKFRRSTLANYFTSHGLTSGNVQITVRGTSNTLPSWSFEASDTTHVIP